MANVALELSDVGLLAAGGVSPSLLKVDGDRSESPGVALQTKKKIVLGWQAKQQERLYPRQCTDRFWSLLSTEPLQERGVDVRNYAELAVAHLEAVSSAVTVPDPVWVVAVPEFMDQGKLGIFLGAAKALGMSVEGFVSNAVAAVTPADADRSTVHVDVHLHQIELTRIDPDEKRLKRARSYLITDSGWERLEDRVARRLADEFVQTTRFDPLHEAAAEQDLYDQIPGLLEEVSFGQPVPLELKLGKSVYRIAVSVRMIAEACDPLCDKVAESLDGILAEVSGEDTLLDVQVSHRAARVPGLVERIGATAGLDVRVLLPGAGALGALAMGNEFADESEQDGVNFLSSKSIRPGGPPALPVSEALSTHVLLGNRAYPFRQNPVYVVRTSTGMEATYEPGEDEVVYSVRMNEGRAVVDPPDAEVRLIQVQPDGEA